MMMQVSDRIIRHHNFSILMCLLCVACSATKPAPVTDQSTSISKKPPVVIPNWSVTNASETPTPIPKSKTAPKPKPVAEVPDNSQTASQATSTPTPTPIPPRTLPADKPPASEDSVAPSFRISKPSSAKIISAFNGNTNKGVDFGGSLGDPVNSVADGKVIFSGNSLRSYGNLVIVKHNNSFISIYAHNSKNIVKEGDVVKRGQKISEMGNSEADRVKLHFELRKNSKPIDPSPYFDN